VRRIGSVVVAIAIALAIAALSPACAKKSATCKKLEACCLALAGAADTKHLEGLPSSCEIAGRDDTTCQNDYFAMVGKVRAAQTKDRALRLPPACP
jgi:hypothetical protein